MSEYYRSPLARELEDFVTHMRALGYSYRRAAATLKSFDGYVLTHAGHQRILPLANLLRGWLSRRGNRKPVTVAMDLGTLRQFFRYRRRFDPDGFIPGREWAPQAPKSDFLPYIFSVEQVRALLDEAAHLRCSRRVRTAMRALILILYCTGLRFGEAIRLEMQDVDLHRRLFRIRESKGRTRLVPFRADLARELREYRKQRDQIAPMAPCAAFLVRPDGKAFSIKGASGIIRGMLRRLGFKPHPGRTGPRPYDLRHTYAVHRLVSWHRAGVDVHAKFPWLSAYLGHENILGTEVYLHATTELLQLASRRFHSRLHRNKTP
jgi:integrase/recombinase XerD